MFEVAEIPTARPLVLLKQCVLLLLSLYLIIGFVSAYRAFYQVHSLALITANPILREGSVIETSVISYARTHVDVKLELIQGTNSAILAVQTVPGNEWGFFDPRNRRGSQTATITSDILARFQPGKAQLRATATGRPQWTRLPPPVIQELVVNLQRN
ncbi:MAG TPA: hypothetical protein VJU86_23525 [Pyrinomonadaceae bacterium]|nr:hypothetical protein [Pyrinomonadaceae bacterium]